MGGDPDGSGSKRAVIGSRPLFEEGVRIPSLTVCCVFTIGALTAAALREPGPPLW